MNTSQWGAQTDGSPVPKTAAKSTFGNTYPVQEYGPSGYAVSRVRSHHHDHANLPIPQSVKLTVTGDGTKLEGPTEANPTFRNSASSPYWPLPPAPFCNAVVEDLAALRRQPTVPLCPPLEGDPLVPPEMLVRHDKLYLGEAEETLRRQTANRLMGHLPEMAQETEERADRDSRTCLASDPNTPWHHPEPVYQLPFQQGPYVVPKGVASADAGMLYAGQDVARWGADSLKQAPPRWADAWHPAVCDPNGRKWVAGRDYGNAEHQGTGYSRTPVDTSSRLLQSYLFSTEPAFCTTTPGYQASRVGDLASETNLARNMGPVGPVQGLMHSRYNLASRFEQESKNLSLGRNALGPVCHSRSPIHYPGAPLLGAWAGKPGA